MSQWTHVVGAIRVDGLPDLGDGIQRLYDAMGKTNTFDNFEEWVDDIPTGSEGSLQYHIHEYYGGMPWCVVTIWGDLRSYTEDGFDDIEAWFHKKCEVLGHIRDGVIRMETNVWNGTEYATLERVVSYKEKKNA